MNSELFIIFGDHLFPINFFKDFKSHKFLMIESYSICEHFKYHKLRLAFILSAARHKYLELKNSGYKIDYIHLQDHSRSKSYIDRLKQYCLSNKITKIHAFEKEDKFFHKMLNQFATDNAIELVLYRSPAFLNDRDSFKTYLSKHKRPFMKNFYEDSRKKFNILIDKNRNPVGEKWSFDDENRSKLKKTTIVPDIKIKQPDKITLDVIALINKDFPGHPGELLSDGSNFIFPVSRDEALLWLEQFLIKRFKDFGEFEDAISSQHDFLFHSLLSPLLNFGILTPKEVVARSLSFAEENNTPINSLEGLIRQIIGWREFVRGIYHEFSDIQDERNFFNHKRKLNASWYDATTGIDPVDCAIKKVTKYAYLHHIERLMVMSNVMLLCEVDPREVHRWFNEMFVDSLDWVMGPNVYGMGQFSDGGIFATKPYICGSNYIIKMSDYKKGEWSEEMDALYWSFIDKNREFFNKNPRLSMMVNLFDKMSDEKKKNHLMLAELVKCRLTNL
ncbi:MAG: cryptochrome/photolyase family protein [Bacteriovorax sp.]|nr:cryptochrome/photolyase family protein [Bacteriovorax sp.]